MPKVHRCSNSWRLQWAQLIVVALLTACGGGGSSPSPGQSVTLSLSPTQISVTALTGTPAPTASLDATITATVSSSKEYYLKGSYTSNGIASVTDPDSNGNLEIQFKDPTSLGVGTYNDAITIEACPEQACTTQLANSPQQVAVKYTVSQAPSVISSLQPAAMTAGGPAFTLTVNGSNFTSGSIVQWAGAPLTATFVSASELTAAVPAADVSAVGTFAVTVETDDVVSTPVLFAVQALVTPAITGFSPGSATIDGAAFTLTVNGSNFSTLSVVNWNGSARSTTYASATQLTAQITAADIANAATVPITVVTLTQTSAPVNFAVQPLPALALNSVTPWIVDAGNPAFPLTVNGAGFTAASTVLWNGSVRATTYVSTNVLQAQILTTDVAAIGTGTVTVQNPANQGGTTPNGETVQIVKAGIDSVAYQINPAHSGAMTFQSMSLPTNALWSVNVGGNASFALIATGMVYVTVTVPSATTYNSELIALNQSSGATVWGPVALSGPASAAYENGAIFVISGGASSPGTLQAFDAATGNLKWSYSTPTFGVSTGGISALNGIVYVGMDNDGGTLDAFNEFNGALIWSQAVNGGEDSTPAVTSSGVYVDYSCQVYDFDPATGASIWHYNGPCEGGGGATPIVANGTLYAANATPGPEFAGQTFNASTGAAVSTFTADDPPAFGTTNGYLLLSGTLQGQQLSNNSVLWSFTGDGNLITAPILVNNDVFIGSSSGNVYAIDGTTGAQLWQVNVGAPMTYGTFTDDFIPYYGLSAGDGLLIVPAGNTVTAYQLSTDP